MTLTEPDAINAAMQHSTARIVATTLATSVAIDNEALVVGNTRKLRRLIIENLDNIICVFHLATQDAAAANDADLPQKYALSNYETKYIEPEKVDEYMSKILGTATVRRFSGYVRNLDDSGAPAGITNGVRLLPDYYDDLD